MAALLVFIIATLEIGRKKLLDAKGSFGDNVFKAPAKITSKAGDETSSVKL